MMDIHSSWFATCCLRKLVSGPSHKLYIIGIIVHFCTYYLVFNCLLSPMGGYGSRTRKPTICFGTPFHPQSTCVQAAMCVSVLHLSRAFWSHLSTVWLRRWLDQLACKLGPKEKARIEKAKTDTKKAMVIKRINKRGNVSVYPGRIFAIHAISWSCMLLRAKTWPITMFKRLVDHYMRWTIHWFGYVKTFRERTTTKSYLLNGICSSPGHATIWMLTWLGWNGLWPSGVAIRPNNWGKEDLGWNPQLSTPVDLPRRFLLFISESFGIDLDHSWPGFTLIIPFQKKNVLHINLHLRS